VEAAHAAVLAVDKDVGDVDSTSSGGRQSEGSSVTRTRGQPVAVGRSAAEAERMHGCERTAHDGDEMALTLLPSVSTTHSTLYLDNVS
jgi:hypothetical protein